MTIFSGAGSGSHSPLSLLHPDAKSNPARGHSIFICPIQPANPETTARAENQGCGVREIDLFSGAECVILGGESLLHTITLYKAKNPELTRPRVITQ